MRNLSPAGQCGEITERRAGPRPMRQPHKPQCVCLNHLASLLSPTTFLLGIYPMWTYANKERVGGGGGDQLTDKAEPNKHTRERLALSSESRGNSLFRKRAPDDARTGRTCRCPSRSPSRRGPRRRWRRSARLVRHQDSVTVHFFLLFLGSYNSVQLNPNPLESFNSMVGYALCTWE